MPPCGYTVIDPTMTTFKRRSVIAGIGGTVLASLAGCLGDDDDDGNGDGNGDDSPEGRVDAFLSDNDARMYDGNVEDLTGEDTVEVSVGAGDEGLAFDPAAIRIDTGTTVVWEWTGEGGAHNVQPTGDTDFDDFGDSERVDEAGHTVESTFDEAGVGLYVCQPHAGQGMYGAVIVE